MKIDGTNISHIRSDTGSFLITCAHIDGTPEPLVEGDIIYFTVKENVNVVEKVLQKIVTDFTDGSAIVTLTPEDTRGLHFKTYVYDIQLSRADGSVYTIIPPSSFTVKEEVTYE